MNGSPNTPWKKKKKKREEGSPYKTRRERNRRKSDAPQTKRKSFFGFAAIERHALLEIAILCSIWGRSRLIGCLRALLTLTSPRINYWARRKVRRRQGVGRIHGD